MLATPVQVSLSVLAQSRIRRASQLRSGANVVVSDDRSVMSREGTVFENQLSRTEGPMLAVLFKLPGTRSIVEYSVDDFERFEFRST